MNPLPSDDLLPLARFALDRADDGAFWTDANGKLLYANEAAGRVLGYSPTELLQVSLFDISPELTPELWTQLWKEIQAFGTFAFEFTLRDRKNRVFPVEMTVHRAALSGQDVLCGFFRDIDEKKRLHQLKNEFVSTVSHELRTPMTIIRESVSQLLDGLWGEIPGQQREALLVTLSGIDRLARIVNDLLDVSKMEAGKSTLRWERLDLVELVREVMDTFASRARERGLLLGMETAGQSVILYADYDRLLQVFTNLVDNALKFSEKGKIEVRLVERETDVECAVIDSGIGIAQEDLQRIFNKFEQSSHPAVTGEKGSGLGLSICKGIVEMHQGRIWVESRPGEGSSFLFTIPKRSGRDLFKQKMSSELARAASAGGFVTGVVFTVQTLPSQTVSRHSHLTGWALKELVETIKTQGARKSDVLLEDSNAVWLGLLGMTQKEAQRIVRRIQTVYADLLEKKELADMVQVRLTQCSFPEDVHSEKEFLAKLLGATDAP